MYFAFASGCGALVQFTLNLFNKTMMLQQLLQSAFAGLARCRIGWNQARRVSQRVLADILPQSAQHKKWLVLSAAALPVLGAVVAIASSGPTAGSGVSHATDKVVEAINLQLEQTSVYAVDPLVVEEKIRRGETPFAVLRRMGINTARLAVFASQDPIARKLLEARPGRFLSVQQNAEGDLLWLRYRTGLDEEKQETVLIQERAGKWVAKRELLDLKKQLVFKAGRVDTTLFAAADKAELPDAVATQLSDIFSSEIDFHQELKRGDEFRVVYEDFTAEGRSVRSGRVLAVEFINNGRSYRAYWFNSRGYPAAYYDQNGKALRKSFLRSPLAFSRISSGFTGARFHPVLQQWRAHTGVDYAAPTGTPIMATSSGKVKFIGSQSGYGNMVEIQHHGQYSTAYAHMSAFARGLRKGSTVEQGQVIGYVGSTGWATGPHLHYEFRVNSVPRDPLSVSVAHNATLDRFALREFKATQIALDRRMVLASTVRLAQAQ